MVQGTSEAARLQQLASGYALLDQRRLDCFVDAVDGKQLVGQVNANKPVVADNQIQPTFIEGGLNKLASTLGGQVFGRKE